ncbi:hypothetical protein GCM10023201_33930 [Actinomycetospora corticicola]
MPVKRRLLIVLGVLAVLSAVATTAYAAAPRATVPTLDGCVNKQTGVLRVATPTRGCITRPGFLQETPVRWNLVDTSASVPLPVMNGPAKPRVERRSVSKDVPGSYSGTLVRAECRQDETVVTGSWTVDGRPEGDTAGVGYSLGDTGERTNGFQVLAYGGPDTSVTATAVCLAIA